MRKSVFLISEPSTRGISYRNEYAKPLKPKLQFQIYDEVREKMKQEIVEKQQHHFNKIQEAREKVEQQEKEEAEQKRKKTEEKELQARLKREIAIMNLKENLHKQNCRASDVYSEKKREKEMHG